MVGEDEREPEKDVALGLGFGSSSGSWRVVGMGEMDGGDREGEGV